MKTQIEPIINYSEQAIRWHLNNNIHNLKNPQSIELIVTACNDINNGTLFLSSDSPFNCTWEEVLADLVLLD